MKIIQQAFKLDNLQYYTLHLQILNAILPVKLTDKELEVLAAFMSLDKSIIEDNYFNPVSRKKVMTKLELKPGGLSNHLSELIKKGFLVKNNITNAITIRDFLLPEEDGQGYELKIIKNEANK